MFLTKRNSLVHKIVDQLIVKESVIVFHGGVYFLVGPRTPLQRWSDYHRQTRQKGNAEPGSRRVFCRRNDLTRLAGSRTKLVLNRFN